MTNRIAESELILKPGGSIYHLNLFPEEISNTIIVVGDPNRVAQVSKYFDSIEVNKQNREITTHTGYYNGKRLTVMSTGMGTDNIDVCINELDALVNIDLKTRIIKPKLTKLNIIRLGTCGSLQPNIPLNSFVVSSHGLGLDVVMQYYQRNISDDVTALTKAFLQHISAEVHNLRPYIAEGSRKFIGIFKDTCIEGITASAAGFYAPEGRILRYKLAMPNLIDKLTTFRHNGMRITNMEMETSALYGLGHEILGHNCCSVNVVIAHRPNKTFSSKPAESVEKMIQMALEKLSR